MPSSSWNRSTTGVIRAVDDVSLAVAAGETLGLVGATGSGKSTIAQLILGMVWPTHGTVTVLGRDLRALRGAASRRHRRRIQVVLQDPYSSLDPRMRVGDIVAESLIGDRLTTPKSILDGRVAELLRLVGLPARSVQQFPHQFSGGQRQRIAIARALAPNPDMILLDEPTSALDVSVRAQILNLLKDLQGTLGVTYLFISHDLTSVGYMASRVAVMYLGKIVESGPTTGIHEAPLHPYTWLLHASVPSRTGSFGHLTAFERTSDVARRPIGAVGCAYRTSCPLRAALGDPRRCTDETPALRRVVEGRFAACHFAEDAYKLRDSGSH